MTFFTRIDFDNGKPQPTMEQVKEIILNFKGKYTRDDIFVKVHLLYLYATSYKIDIALKELVEDKKIKLVTNHGNYYVIE